jgi:glycosyltransferase involved in cell wall biosynthesis
MKIGIDARMYTPECTGISRYLRELTSHLFAIDKTNEYLMFMLEPEYSKFEAPNERVKKIKVDSYWYGYKEQLILPWQMLKAGCDLIHFPNFNTPLIYPKKSVVTIHDITPFFFSGHRRQSKWRDFAFWQVFSRSVKRATKVIAVSQSTKADIIKYFKIAPEKIEVIYNGLDQKFFQRATQAEIQKLKDKYKISGPFILYVGVWRNHKNVVGLLKAFKLLLNKYQCDYQLVLLGKELPEYPAIRKTWQQLNLEKNLVLPGFVSDEELLLFYQASDLLVIPSLAEGFGFTGLEALASGTTVAASDISALEEVLGESASYFDPHNPEEMAEVIFNLLTNQNLQQKKLAKAENQLKKYSWLKNAEQTLKLYQDILGK